MARRRKDKVEFALRYSTKEKKWLPGFPYNSPEPYSIETADGLRKFLDTVMRDLRRMGQKDNGQRQKVAVDRAMVAWKLSNERKTRRQLEHNDRRLQETEARHQREIEGQRKTINSLRRKIKVLEKKLDGYRLMTATLMDNNVSSDQSNHQTLEASNSNSQAEQDYGSELGETKATIDPYFRNWQAPCDA